MDSVNLFGLASDHSRWLTVRQTAVAQNIANANTPGYKAIDIEPFEATLSSTRLEMARTQGDHMQVAGAGKPETRTEESEGWQVVHSGNNVNFEEQLMRSSEVSGAYSLNTTIVKAFHRMLLSSSRG